MAKAQHISILIIEDNPGDQLLLQENLISTNLLIADIIMVETLAEGISHLSKQNFSLIFLDLFLPDSTGLDSLSELIKINSSIPVVISSGLSDTQIALKAITLGAQDFLIKGDYTVNLLEKTVRYSIERKNNLDALEESNAKYVQINKELAFQNEEKEKRAAELIIANKELKTAKEELTEKEFFLRESQRAGNIGSYETNFVKGYWQSSETLDGIFGIDKNYDRSIAGWLEIVHPDDRQNMDEYLRLEVIGKRKSFNKEYRIVRINDKQTRWVHGRGDVKFDDSGNVTDMIGTIHDITEHKNAGQKIEESEKRFRQIVETAQEGIWMIDVNNQTIFVNKKMCEIMEYTEEEMMGRTNLSFKDAEEQKIALQQIKRIKKGIKETYESKFITKSGRHIYTQVSTNPILGEDGYYIGALAMMTDITEKKLADDELKKLSMVAKETINGVVIRDKDQNIVWVNNAFTKMFGYELDEVIGKNVLQFLPGPETDVEVLNYATEQLMEKEPFVFEILNYTKAGDKIYVRVQRQPIFDTNGDVKQFFALFTDITRQRELEGKVELEKNIKQKEITEAVIIAQESERSKIGRELHDNVNQLLGATKLYIDMGKRDDENRESLLASASTYTLTAIEEIRKLSKILITPLIKEIGLTDSIKGLTKEIMLVHPIQILFNAKDFIEAGFSDKFKLNIFRIVQEQINNTLKHAQAKKININIEDNYGKLLFSIADDGIGFDTSKRRTGIGITNIKSRSELYNGTMQLNSEQGKGTTLSITFNKTDLLLNNHNESNS
jgi:PAS domain S-box-containing protein